MSKVKGRYVATVILDIEYDESSGTTPFEDVRASICYGGLTEALQACIDAEFAEPGISTATVEQQSADLYRVDEDLRKV